MTSYENIVRGNDPDLYELVSRDIDLIPLYSRDVESIKRWSGDVEQGHREGIWASLYRELSAINQYADVMKIINSKNASFAKIPKGRLNEFIEAFPTVLWVLLLQTNSSSPNAFRLLEMADRLDWVDEVLLKLTNVALQNAAHVRVWPKSFTNPIIIALTSPEMAVKIWSHSHMPVHNARKIDGGRITETAAKGQWGYVYYAVVPRDFPLPPSFWRNLILNSPQRIPENLVIFLLDRINETTNDANNFLPTLATRGYHDALRIFLQRYPTVRSWVGIYPIPDVETAKILVEHNIWQSPVWWDNNIVTIDEDVLDYLLDRDAFAHVLYITNRGLMFLSVYRRLLGEVGTESRLKILSKYMTELHIPLLGFSPLYTYLSDIDGPKEEKLRILVETGIPINTPEILKNVLEKETDPKLALLYATTLTPYKRYDIIGDTTIDDSLAKDFDECVKEIIAKRFYSEKTVMRNIDRLLKESDRYKELLALTKKIYKLN